MIKKKTVLVLGAGASAPYGFPTGAELRKKIINDYDSIATAIGDDGIQYDKESLKEVFRFFAYKFRDSGTSSIDLFLSQQEKNDIDLGKALILSVIRHCEHVSKYNEDIYRIQKNKDVKKDIDWYKLFLFKLFSGIQSFEEISFQNLEVITFNYDRSFEFYIYQSLRNWFPFTKINDKQIIDLINSLKIHHVFGMVDEYPWKFPNNIFANVKNNFFRFFITPEEAFSKINSIRVINEIKKFEENEYKKIIESAEKVFFLGFGYLEENMKILGYPFTNKTNWSPGIFGTCLNKTPQQILQIKQYFQMPDELIKFVDTDSYGLLADYLE